MQLLRYHTHVLECRPSPTGQGPPVWVKMPAGEYQADAAQTVVGLQPAAPS